MSIRNLGRYREIAGVLMRYGMGEALSNISQGRWLSATLSPSSVRAALCELGPAYIKIGQVLSSRPELLSLPFREELAKLRDEVTPSPFPAIRSVIEEEFGESIDTLFAYVDVEPLACGSIGQVHRGRLHDGTEIVVKVQRPGLYESFKCDSAIIRSLTNASADTAVRGDRISRLIAEFISSVELELDYKVEAEHLERFRWHFEADESVCIPRPFRSHSTHRVLTMTYLPGKKFSKILGSAAERRTIAALLASNVLTQIFQYGYFHSDPHSANVAVNNNGGLTFYDFGLVGELSMTDRCLVAQMLLALQSQQPDLAVSTILQLAANATHIDTSQLRADLHAITVAYFNPGNSTIAAHAFLKDILTLTEKHALVLPSGYYQLFRVLMTLEGTARDLDPSFNLAEISLPIIRKASAQDRPPVQAAHLYELADSLMDQLENLPPMLKDTFLQLNQGRLRIQFEHRGLEEAIRSHSVASRRLGVLILLSATTLGIYGMLCSLVVSKLIQLVPAIIAGCSVGAVLLALSLWLFMDKDKRNKVSKR